MSSAWSAMALQISKMPKHVAHRRSTQVPTSMPARCEQRHPARFGTPTVRKRLVSMGAI
jgi:hypothetical protein